MPVKKDYNTSHQDVQEKPFPTESKSTYPFSKRGDTPYEQIE